MNSEENQNNAKKIDELTGRLIDQSFKAPGSISNYQVIAVILLISFLLNSIILLALNMNSVEQCLINSFSVLKFEILQQFFYGALGATISCSIYMGKDKEYNEVESRKEKPSPIKLRYPTGIDVQLYVQRILASGILAILGTLLLLGGFSYLKVETNSMDLRIKILFAVASMLIGLYQFKFLDKIGNLVSKIFGSSSDVKNDE